MNDSSTPEFPGYTLGAILHATAVGLLYSARSKRGRQVWLYVYHEQVSNNPGLRIHLIRSAKESATLRHTNVARVKEVIEHPRVAVVFEAPGAWLLSEVLHEGELQNKAFSEAMAVLVATDVCKGLTYLHAKADRGRPLELHHGTLAPHFIAIDTQGHAKILDPGMGRAENQDIIHDVMLGEDASYLAPEQCEGETNRSSDIFSLGLVLHQMLGNRAPVRGREVEGLYGDSLEPPTPRDGALNSSLKRLLMKSLSLNGQQRYPYARMLQSHLQSWVATHVGRRSQAGLDTYLGELFEEAEDAGDDAPTDSAAWDLDRIPTGRIDQLVRPTLPPKKTPAFDPPTLRGEQVVPGGVALPNLDAPTQEDAETEEDDISLNSTELDALTLAESIPPGSLSKKPEPLFGPPAPAPPVETKGFDAAREEVVFGDVDVQLAVPTQEGPNPQHSSFSHADDAPIVGESDVEYGIPTNEVDAPDDSVSSAELFVTDPNTSGNDPAVPVPNTAERPSPAPSAPASAPVAPKQPFPLLPVALGVAALMILGCMASAVMLLASGDDELAEEAPPVAAASTAGPSEEAEKDEPADEKADEGPEDEAEFAVKDAAEAVEDQGSEMADEGVDSPEAGAETAVKAGEDDPQEEGEDDAASGKTDEPEGEDAEKAAAKEPADAESGEEKDDRPSWVRNGQGLLVVQAKPRSIVRLNGRRRGYTPAYLVVKPGKYKVTIQNPKMRRAVTKKVRVPKGKRRVVRHKFK